MKGKDVSYLSYLDSAGTTCKYCVDNATRKMYIDSVFCNFDPLIIFPQHGKLVSEKQF